MAEPGLQEPINGANQTEDNLDEEQPTDKSAKAQQKEGNQERELRQRYHPINREEWLKSHLVHRHDVGLDAMRVRDYLDITLSEDPVDAYWHDTHIDWCLDLLGRKYEGFDDILIGTRWHSWCLYNIWKENHKGTTSKSPDKEFLAELAQLKSRAIVVLPVNDGFTHETMEIPTRATEGAAYEEAVKEHKENGTHWSFIVLDMRDTTNRTARYIDPLVKTKYKNGKEIITGYEINAPIAGKILCGFDLLLGLEQGRFVTSTLKWTPHQWRDNRSKNDFGACGPYMYAFLDYLLQRRNLIDSGLAESFTKELLPAHRLEFDFDSTHTREDFQTEIRKVRQILERENKDWHPFNLTPEVLRDIVTEDLLYVLAGMPRRAPRPIWIDSDVTDDSSNVVDDAGDGDDNDDDDGEASTSNGSDLSQEHPSDLVEKM